MNRARALQQCAEWLSACLRIGWDKKDLDALERLWWTYHDEQGRHIHPSNQRQAKERR